MSNNSDRRFDSPADSGLLGVARRMQYRLKSEIPRTQGGQKREGVGRGGGEEGVRGREGGVSITTPRPGTVHTEDGKGPSVRGLADLTIGLEHFQSFRSRETITCTRLRFSDLLACPMLPVPPARHGQCYTPPPPPLAIKRKKERKKENTNESHYGSVRRRTKERKKNGRELL